MRVSAVLHFVLFARFFLLAKSLRCFKGKQSYGPRDSYCACYFELSVENYESPVYVPKITCNDEWNRPIWHVLNNRCRRLKFTEKFQGTTSYIKIKPAGNSASFLEARAQYIPTDVFLFCCKDCPELTTENSKFFDGFLKYGLERTFQEEMALDVHNSEDVANIRETTCWTVYNRRVHLLPGNHACMLFASSHSKTPVYAGNVMYRHIHRPHIANVFENMYYCSFRSNDGDDSQAIPDEWCASHVAEDYHDITCCCYTNLSRCGVLENPDDVICARFSAYVPQPDSKFSKLFDIKKIHIGKNCLSEFGVTIVRYGVTLDTVQTSTDTEGWCEMKGDRNELACKVKEGSVIGRCPFLPNYAHNTEYLTVVCCCGAVDGGDQASHHFCNHRQAFNFSKLLLDKGNAPQCHVNNVFMRYFANHVFGNSCIIHYDFTLMKPVDLIIETNMLLANYETSKRAYRTKETFILVDVIADKKRAGICTETVATTLDILQSKYKAWTVAVIKCDSSSENEKCDQMILKNLLTQRTVEKYQEMYGTECYVGTKENVTIKRSLKTRWCFERIRAHGESLEYERDFFMIDTINRIKDVPKTFQCLEISNGTKEYAASMRRNCFTRKVKVAEGNDIARKGASTREEILETFCCCINLNGRVPCNICGMSEHFDQSTAQYGREGNFDLQSKNWTDHQGRCSEKSQGDVKKRL